jgi:hypothetical protein
MTERGTMTEVLRITPEQQGKLRITPEQLGKVRITPEELGMFPKSQPITTTGE